MATVPSSKLEEIRTDPVSFRNDLILDTARQLTEFFRCKDSENFVVVATGARVPVVGKGRGGLLLQVFYVPRLSQSLVSVSLLAKEGVKILFQDDHAIISKGEAFLDFTTLKAKKIIILYEISQLQFELCTRIPHVECLAHMPIEEVTLETCVLADEIRTDSISNNHYMIGHPSAECTRYICKYYQLKDIQKLEH